MVMPLRLLHESHGCSLDAAALESTDRTLKASDLVHTSSPTFKFPCASVSAYATLVCSVMVTDFGKISHHKVEIEFMSHSG